MTKLDIKIMEFGTKIQKLKEEVRGLVCDDVFDKDSIIQKVNEISYYNELYRRWVYCNDYNNIIISGMFTDKGNEIVSESVVEFVKTIIDETETENAVSILNKRIEKISEQHKEVTDSAVRESIWWYLYPFVEIYDINTKDIKFL